MMHNNLQEEEQCTVEVVPGCTVEEEEEQCTVEEEQCTAVQCSGGARVHPVHPLLPTSVVSILP